VKPTIEITDVIGNPPTRGVIPELDAALKELENLTGLESVKVKVEQLVELAHSNYEQELAAEPIDLVPLNRLFLGNPGTGKVLFFKFVVLSFGLSLSLCVCV